MNCVPNWFFCHKSEYWWKLMSLKITSTFGSTNASGKEQIQKRFKKKLKGASLLPSHRVTRLLLEGFLRFEFALCHSRVCSQMWAYSQATCTSWTDKSWSLLGTIKINCFSFKRCFKSHALKQSQKAGNFKMDFRIGLMWEYVTCSKFTSKPCYGDIFSNFHCPRVVFAWVFFLSWLL